MDAIKPPEMSASCLSRQTTRCYRTPVDLKATGTGFTVKSSWSKDAGLDAGLEALMARRQAVKLMDFAEVRQSYFFWLEN